MLLDDPVEHGWDLNGKVKWGEKCFPDDLSDLLISYDKMDCDNDADNDLKSILMMMRTNLTLQMMKRNLVKRTERHNISHE